MSDPVLNTIPEIIRTIFKCHPFPGSMFIQPVSFSLASTAATALAVAPMMNLSVYGHSLKELEIESVKTFNDAIIY